MKFILKENNHINDNKKKTTKQRETFPNGTMRYLRSRKERQEENIFNGLNKHNY